MSTFTDTQAALAICLAAKQPVVLWGDPGEGKTASIEAIAESQGKLMETVIASIREPADFAGLPNIVDGRTTMVPPDWALNVAEHDGEAMIFLDEISTAPPATQAALLRPVVDNVVGSLHLGDNVSWVMAANPPESAADGWDLAMPMANRLTHLDWELPAEVVSDGFALGWPEVEVPSPDPKKIDEAVREAKLLVGAFLRARKDWKSRMPDSSSEGGRAWPSPRSWENAAILYGYANAAGAPKTVRRMLVGGTVGDAACGEFLVYVDELDLPNPEDVLADPSKWEVPTRSDKVYAVGASVLAAVQQDMTNKRWLAVGNVMERMVEEGKADSAVAIGKKWMSMRPSSKVTPDPKHLKSLIPVLQRAKILP